MSERAIAVREHPVWAEMNALSSAIDAATGIAPAASKASGDIERVRIVLAFIGRRLASTDPELVRTSVLDSLLDDLSKINLELDGFIGDGDQARLERAGATSDDAIEKMVRLPGPSPPEEMGSFVDELHRYRVRVEEGLQAATSAIKSMASESTSLSDRLPKIQEEQERLSALQLKSEAERTESIRAFKEATSVAIETEGQRLRGLLEEQRNAFADRREAQDVENTELARVAQQRLDSIVSNQQDKFSTSQDSRGKEFGETQTARQSKFDGIVSDFAQRLADQSADFTIQRTELVRSYEDQLKALRLDYSDRATLVLSRVEEQEERVNVLVGLIGTKGVTAGYQAVANLSRKMMWLWQIGTVASICGLIGVGIHSLMKAESGDQNLQWPVVVNRLFVGLACGVLAAYSGSQADKLFEAEKKNRRLALELQAIAPYLEPLPQNARDDFRIKIGERTFGRDESEVAALAKSPATAADVIAQRIVKLLEPVIDKVMGK